jgi:hypothetical protein
VIARLVKGAKGTVMVVKTGEQQSTETEWLHFRHQGYRTLVVESARTHKTLPIVVVEVERHVKLQLKRRCARRRARSVCSDRRQRFQKVLVVFFSIFTLGYKL